MKFKTPSKPVVNLAYYASNKRPEKSQNITRRSSVLSKPWIINTGSPGIQVDENQASMQSCKYYDQAYSNRCNISGIVPGGKAATGNYLEQLRIFNSPVTNQTIQS